jgi:hypothetical protein
VKKANGPAAVVIELRPHFETALSCPAYDLVRPVLFVNVAAPESPEKRDSMFGRIGRDTPQGALLVVVDLPEGATTTEPGVLRPLVIRRLEREIVPRPFACRARLHVIRPHRDDRL